MRHLYTYISLLLLLLAGNTFANGFSYVYIQGDKQTPFYVKFEDEMMPRYGKNYCIISQLAPGPVKVQILFQQNIYPVQTFTIQVPENGCRGFLLTRKNDEISLYDLQEQFYLPAGNSIEDDKVQGIRPVKEYKPAYPQPEHKVTNIAQLKAVEGEEHVEQTESNVTNTTIDTPPPSIPENNEPVVNTKQVNGPEFVDFEIDNNQKSTNSGTVRTNDQYKGQVAIPNSDCPKAIDLDLFEAIQKKANDKSDNNRLKYLLDKTEENCFTTNQARILARTLKNDPERYTFLKKVYSRITDQAKFPALESLLTTQEWKGYFRLILP